MVLSDYWTEGGHLRARISNAVTIGLGSAAVSSCECMRDPRGPPDTLAVCGGLIRFCKLRVRPDLQHVSLSQ